MFTQHAIAKKVQDRLKRPGLKRTHFNVIEKEIWRDQNDDSWYVPIQPDSEPKDRARYFQALADIAIELLEEEDINILFIPTAPDEPGEKISPIHPVEAGKSRRGSAQRRR